MTKRGLEPVVDADSRVLILGTMPGDESLRLGRYYANPSNQFWSILSQVYGESVGPNYEAKLQFLRRKGVALWDVLKEAVRPGSLDSSITDEVVNDFHTFFQQYPKLEAVRFNGQKAEALFRTHVLAPGVLTKPLRMVALPSSSATPGRNVLPLADKVHRWREFLRPDALTTGPTSGST